MYNYISVTRPFLQGKHVPLLIHRAVKVHVRGLNNSLYLEVDCFSLTEKEDKQAAFYFNSQCQTNAEKV